MLFEKTRMSFDIFSKNRKKHEHKNDRYTYRTLTPAVEGDGTGGVLRKVDADGVGVGTQLLDESFLGVGHLDVSSMGSDLGVDELELLAEVKSHDLILLAAVAVGDRHAREDPPSTQVVMVHDNHTVHGGGVADVVHEVPPT